MKITQCYMHDAISADVRAHVTVPDTPMTWFFATKINGQRPEALPS